MEILEEDEISIKHSTYMYYRYLEANNDRMIRQIAEFKKSVFYKFYNLFNNL